MQITINQTEIERAISEYLNKRIKIEDGVEVAIDIRATRGPEGITAVIDIDDSSEAIEETKVAEKSRRKEVREEKLDNASRFLKETVTPTEPKKEESDSKPEAAAGETGSTKEESDAETKPVATKSTSTTKSIFGRVTPN
jgi:hypothetical protein